MEAGTRITRQSKLAAVRRNNGWRLPAERLNKHRSHDNRLRNLLASAPPGG